MFLERYRLDGKVAVITGGSRGIGRAIALGFAEAGADIVVASRKLPDLEAVASEISAQGRRSLAIPTHAGRKQDIENLVKRTMDEFGRIDILVNDAGTNPAYGWLVDVEEGAWDATMGVNLKGYFLLSQAVAKIMIEQKSGCIISLASVASFEPSEKMGVYSISKAGVVSLTQALALELGKYGIRVNAIAPGTTRTDMTRPLFEDKGFVEAHVARTPLGSLGEPEDMVGAAIYLASDASRHVTGQTIVIDGGHLIS
jgi:dehydrogenase/reductase SDR family protein 4